MGVETRLSTNIDLNLVGTLDWELFRDVSDKVLWNFELFIM